MNCFISKMRCSSILLKLLVLQAHDNKYWLITLTDFNAVVTVVYLIARVYLYVYFLILMVCGWCNCCVALESVQSPVELLICVFVNVILFILILNILPIGLFLLLALSCLFLHVEVYNARYSSVFNVCHCVLYYSHLLSSLSFVLYFDSEISLWRFLFLIALITCQCVFWLMFGLWIKLFLSVLSPVLCSILIYFPIRYRSRLISESRFILYFLFVCSLA